MAETEVLNRDIIHVLPEAGHWRVDGSGGGVFDTKDEAVRHSQQLAVNNAPCRVQVHTEDGSVEDEFNYE